MSLYHSTICAVLLLSPLFCGDQILSQDNPPLLEQPVVPQERSVSVAPKYHHCFEKPEDAKEAIHRLPAIAHYWLKEDGTFIISPVERCVFLHLNSDDEREQFIEQFWYRRSVEPISLDYDFKTEFYRRIVFANETYGSKLLEGRNTDRGRLYVIFGPPDSVDNPAVPHSVETWHYHYIKGIGENVQIHFEYIARYDDYLLPDADRDLVGEADPSPDQFPITLESIGRFRAVDGPPKLRFEDLQAVLFSRATRDQVKIIHRIKFSPATRATTLARISIQIPCKKYAGDGQIPPSSAYPLFIQVKNQSGRVVATRELVVDNVVRDVCQATFHLDVPVYIPLAPGPYELAIAAKNRSTGEAGVIRTDIEVPTYDSLETKN